MWKSEWAGHHPIEMPSYYSCSPSLVVGEVNFDEWNRKASQSSDAASGWAEWALAHPEFGSSINPITTRGADCAHHITGSPPGFQNPAAAL